MDQDSSCAEQRGGHDQRGGAAPTQKGQQDGDCERRGDEYELPPSFWRAVNELDGTNGPAITGIIDLYREFPAWAVWLPRQGGPWAAARPSSERLPVPDLPMIWVHAETSDELADRMRSVEWQLS